MGTSRCKKQEVQIERHSNGEGFLLGASPGGCKQELWWPNGSWSGQTGAGVTRGFSVGIAAPEGLMGLHEEVEGPRRCSVLVCAVKSEAAAWVRCHLQVPDGPSGGG